jgi:coenzyme F420-dependent glucose-6-phosphate dehydrogenase
MDVGYALICEEHPARDLVDAADRAGQAGFAYLSVSDHFHPWTPLQGESPYAWTVLGAIAERVDLPLVTAVTAPYRRYHPAIVAQAAATTATLARGGFTLGVGTGEALNEHVVGGDWPDPAVRQEMLEEAVGVIRRLWTGEEVTHRGPHVTVDRARLFSRPETPPPLVVAAGGPDAAVLAGRLGAGFMGTSPSPDLIKAYREAGGDGPVYGQATVCWAEDEETARRTMHERWRHSAFDWSVNAEIPTPEGFETAAEVVRQDDVTGKKPMGTDVDAYLESLSMYADAGYERVAIHNVGRDQAGFLRFAEVALLPAWRDH